MKRPRATPRTSRLADGRSIHYFDDRPGKYGAPPPDARARVPLSPPAELRHDALVDEPVIVAAHRQDRTHLPTAQDCPLCASTPTRHTEIPASEYDVVVFENRFPSLPAVAPGTAPRGRCEVICYTCDHAGSFARLDDARLRTIADAWVSRAAALADDVGIKYVLCFENRGEEIGVTLHHPHGQIYAYPFVPPQIERMLSVAASHRQRTGACLGCDLLADELCDGQRIVLEGAHGVAYVPLASRWPFEVHVVPRRHVERLDRLTTEELDELVSLQAEALYRLDGLFEHAVPYMAGWFGSAVGQDAEQLHLRLQIVSPQRDGHKLKQFAGSEALAGAFINDVRPEDAAERLRAAPGRRPSVRWAARSARRRPRR